MVKLTKKYPCIESTIDIMHGDTTIRLWVNEEDLIPTDITGYLKNLESFLFELGTRDRIEIINFIAKEIPNINAVQILDRYVTEKGSFEIKYGTVAYTVDFSEDVHG